MTLTIKREFSLIIFGVLFPLIGFSQLSVDADLRLRTEYRHGFQSLVNKDQDPAFFTSQRSRIILGYKEDKYAMRFSIQDVRVWGNQPQTVVSDGLLSVHEAWLEYFFTKKLSLKGGRMELAYDNHRILGNLDWAQQGRKHDLALLKFTDSTFTLHAGFAFNQDREQSATTLYTVPNSYKTMQFLWINKQFGSLTQSFLFLNNGTQYTQTNEAGTIVTADTKFSQTTGFHSEFKKNKWLATAFGYLQTGKDNMDRTLETYDLSAEVGYKLTNQTVVSAGMEYLSGTTNLTTESVNRSFIPFYGTNHLFNGYMDYFYVGNHVNNVGLQDVYVRLKQNLWKGFLSVDVHHFQSAAYVLHPETSERLDKGLGTEIDLTFRQNVTPELTLQVGYSQMFATPTMEILKGGDHTANNNWAYLWIIFKPSLVKKKELAP